MTKLNTQWVDPCQRLPHQEGYYMLYFKNFKQRKGYWNGREFRVHKNEKSQIVDVAHLFFYSRNPL